MRCSTGSPPAIITLGITQPTGFTAPVDPNSYTTRTALVTAPDAYLRRRRSGTCSHRYLEPFVVGKDLQIEA